MGTERFPALFQHSVPSAPSPDEGGGDYEQGSETWLQGRGECVAGWGGGLTPAPQATPPGSHLPLSDSPTSTTPGSLRPGAGHGRGSPATGSSAPPNTPSAAPAPRPHLGPHPKSLLAVPPNGHRGPILSQPAGGTCHHPLDLAWGASKAPGTSSSTKQPPPLPAQPGSAAPTHGAQPYTHAS